MIRYSDVWKGVKKHLGIDLSRYSTPSNMNRKVWSFEFGSCQPTVVTHWCSLPEGLNLKEVETKYEEEIGIIEKATGQTWEELNDS